MRDHKFRAWDKQRNEWYGKSCPESLTFIDFSIFGECTLLCTPGVEDLMHLEINQKTGIKDSNEVELYQKDCVIVPGIGQCEVGICQFYGTVFIDLDGFAHPAIESIAEGDHPTLNGNVYENPGLMK